MATTVTVQRKASQTILDVLRVHVVVPLSVLYRVTIPASLAQSLVTFGPLVVYAFIAHNIEYCN